MMRRMTAEKGVNTDRFESFHHAAAPLTQQQERRESVNHDDKSHNKSGASGKEEDGKSGGNDVWSVGEGFGFSNLFFSCKCILSSLKVQEC